MGTEGLLKTLWVMWGFGVFQWPHFISHCFLITKKTPLINLFLYEIKNSWKHDFFLVIFHGMQSSCKGGDSVKLQRKVTLLPGVRGERLALSSLCFLDIVEGFLLCLFSTEISFTALKSQDSIRQMLKFSWCGSFESIGFGDSSLTILQCLHFWIKSRVWAGNVCQTTYTNESVRSWFTLVTPEGISWEVNNNFNVFNQSLLFVCFTAAYRCFRPLKKRLYWFPFILVCNKWIFRSAVQS